MYGSSLWHDSPPPHYCFVVWGWGSPGCRGATARPGRPTRPLDPRLPSPTRPLDRRPSPVLWLLQCRHIRGITARDSRDHHAFFFLGESRTVGRSSSADTLYATHPSSDDTLHRHSFKRLSWQHFFTTGLSPGGQSIDYKII